MENDNNYINDHGDHDQGGRRPGTKPEDFEGENEVTGYGHKRKPKDQKKGGSGLEEYNERQQERKDSQPNPFEGPDNKEDNVQNE